MIASDYRKRRSLQGAVKKLVSLWNSIENSESQPTRFFLLPWRFNVCVQVLTGLLLASLRPKSLIILSSCLQSWLKRNGNIISLWLTSKNLNFSNKMNSWTVKAHSSYLFYWLVFSLSTQSTQSMGPICHAISTLFRMLYTNREKYLLRSINHTEFTTYAKNFH